MKDFVLNKFLPFMDPVFYGTGCIVWAIFGLALFLVLVIAILYAYAKLWNWNRKTYRLPYQAWDAFKLWRWYLRKNDFTKTVYKVTFYLNYVTATIQDRKYKHNQYQWYRNAVAATLKGIRRRHYANKVK